MCGIKTLKAPVELLSLLVLAAFSSYVSAQTHSPEWTPTQQPHVYRCDCTLAEFDSLTPPAGRRGLMRAQSAAPSFVVSTMPTSGLSISDEI